MDSRVAQTVQFRTVDGEAARPAGCSSLCLGACLATGSSREPVVDGSTPSYSGRSPPSSRTLLPARRLGETESSLNRGRWLPDGPGVAGVQQRGQVPPAQPLGGYLDLFVHGLAVDGSFYLPEHADARGLGGCGCLVGQREREGREVVHVVAHDVV